METELRKIQLTQLEILKIIDKVCSENDIPYSLYAGTLLGAVRHQGFIPWDDDLDICMSRCNYEKFIAVWNKSKPDGYILQNKENTPAFTQSFSKIRKDHSTFLQFDFERGAYHTGIFVDIFPLDRIPNGKIQQLLFRWNCMKYQLFTREFVPSRSNPLVQVISKLMLDCVPPQNRNRVRERLLKKITKYKDKDELGVVAIEIMQTLNTIYPSDILDNFVKKQFEDCTFPCFADWDLNLTMKYGNYMQLPPEEDRVWRHHPIIVDFEHNYEELQ